MNGYINIMVTYKKPNEGYENQKGTNERTATIDTYTFRIDKTKLKVATSKHNSQG